MFMTGIIGQMFHVSGLHCKRGEHEMGLIFSELGNVLTGCQNFQKLFRNRAFFQRNICVIQNKTTQHRVTLCITFCRLSQEGWLSPP